MNILVPWSLASYIPLNGFHPLYRSLAGVEPGPHRLLVPAQLSRELYVQSVEGGVYDAGACPLPPPWAAAAAGEFGFGDYARGFVPAELIHAGRIAADVELHHTAPVTLGTRPFVLQFESLLPVFFPHLQQGAGAPPASLDGIRRFYATLFEQQNCLAVTSHIQSSLDQFSDFFRSSAIDAKLVHVRNGLDAVFRAGATSRSATRVDFLFIDSAHQNPASFSLRGGVVALALALDLLSEGKPVRFHFRTMRPADATLAAWGLDPARVRHHERDGIVWIDHYLTDVELVRLMASCHLLLLPSANLHSVAILSAMANGVVPIVSDTYGTEAYVTDEEDAIVLSGVRAAAWRHDADRRLVLDEHAAYEAARPALVRAATTRVRALLDRPDRIREMGDAARRRSEAYFDGGRFAAALVDLVAARFTAAGRTTGRFAPPAPAIDQTSRAEEWTTDLAPAHFGGPPQPLSLVWTGDGTVTRLRNQYVFVPDSRMGDTSLEHWSDLHFARERFGVVKGRRKTITDDFASAIEAARAGSRDLSSWTVRRTVRDALANHPRSFRAARAAYRRLRAPGSS